MTCHWCKFYRWRATFSIMKANLKIFREKENHLNANVPCSGFFCMRGRWKTRVSRYGVTGCGKHGASMENTRKPLFRSMNFPHHHEKSKFVISNWKENQLAWNAFLDHESALTISGEKKNIQMPTCSVEWLFFVCGGYFIFHSDLRRPCFNFKKKCEY